MITNNIDLSKGDFTITEPGVYTVDLADVNLENGVVMPSPELLGTVTIINRDTDNLIPVKGNAGFQSNIQASNIVIYTSNGVDWYGMGNL